MQRSKGSLDYEASNNKMIQIGKSQGKGIFLFRAINQIADWSDMSNQPEPYIVQRYIHNPLLIGHKKFDMRIYVLVTSHNPLTIYLYRSGFGRFTHYRYDANDIYNNCNNDLIQKCISPMLPSKSTARIMISNEEENISWINLDCIFSLDLDRMLQRRPFLTFKN